MHCYCGTVTNALLLPHCYYRTVAVHCYQQHMCCTMRTCWLRSTQEMLSVARNTGRFTDFCSDKVMWVHGAYDPRDVAGSFSRFQWRLFYERMCFFVILDWAAKSSYELFSLVEIRLCFKEVVGHSGQSSAHSAADLASVRIYFLDSFFLYPGVKKFVGKKFDFY